MKGRWIFLEIKTKTRTRGGSRVKFQISQALNEINDIGISKHTKRENQEDTGIHSYSQMDASLSDSQQFGAFLKAKGVTDLYQVKRAHYRDFISHKQEQGVSRGHLINVETNLRLLAKGMDRLSDAESLHKREWVPKKRLVDTRTREQPKDRSMTGQQIEACRQQLPESAKVALDLQNAFGLRLREVSNTLVAHIKVKDDGSVVWEASNAKGAVNIASGITKAGRARETLCRPEYEQQVRELIEGKNSTEQVVSVGYNTLKSAYHRVGIKGSHAFRHTYARAMLNEEFVNREIESDGPKALQRMLDNRESGFRRDKGFMEGEKELYREVVNAMDQVQSYLGHGTGRMDLAMVYLKNV